MGNSGDKMENIIIIGAGPAGISAALYAARGNLTPLLLNNGIGALAKAEKIEVQYDGNRTDKYGRKLAWIFVDGQLLQDKLVKKGYARVYYVYGKYKYTNKLRASEKVAKRKKLGIWKNYKAAFPDSKSSSNKNTTKKTTTKKVSNTKKNSSKQTSSSSYVWIPRTGSKYHSRSSCSNMRSPSKVKKSEAISRGYTPCSKCY